jgi:hypothetical protein
MGMLGSVTTHRAAGRSSGDLNGCASHRNRNLPKTIPKLALLDRDDRAVVTLGAAVLVHHPAELAFKEPVKLLQDHNRLASLACMTPY